MNLSLYMNFWRCQWRKSLWQPFILFISWPCDVQTQVYSVSSGKLSIRQNVLWNHRGRHFEWWGTMWPRCAVPQSVRIHGMAYSWCRLFQRPRSGSQLPCRNGTSACGLSMTHLFVARLQVHQVQLDELGEIDCKLDGRWWQVDQCGDADLCEVSNVRLRIMGWP